MSQPSVTSLAAEHKQKPQLAKEEDKKKLKELVKEVHFAMLTTIDAENQLHSRPMTVNGELDISGDECAAWFFIYGNSHKVAEMDQHNHQCNLAFSHPGRQTFISASGNGQIIRDRAEIEKRWIPSLKAWFPKGIDEPDVALLKVNITKAEYWDAPSSIVAHAISFVKSQVTGVPADPAAHKALLMKQQQEAAAAAAAGAKTKEQKAQSRGEEGKMQV